ncbi:MAG TPA: hypothetical protein DHU69_04680 [Deltaproteobacteria bacterium]|nr:MAG: hypothetical protein A2090_04500 [Deltaproteobacteria bacterium GWD2_42_10]OGP46048.1 MAG: hypothetical protein A2022_04200 [Deltaproteobacteria bacterium GWF2_42_12]OGQ35900.1 MAG: hypothetical protein A3H47_05570 [Deltaproteobacteria bacterium RIFCSPLOWO2_02_FULL_42_39]OGQ76018.1 MAG: hypothetical protein A2235_06635 [Deltaproteobacteria bacterium RIFOXYA2_FULL_42_10]HAG50503.1 hypothetical protein [Deltaproteobacteria bacterium]
MSFRIRTKLTIAFFGIIFPFLIIAGIITVHNVNNISKFALKAEAISEEMHSVMSLQIALDRALMPGNDYIITGDKKYIDEFNNTSKNVEALIEKAEDALIRLKGIDTPEVKDEMEIFNDVKSAWQHIKEISLKIFAIQNPVGSEEAATLMEEMDYKWSYPAIEKLDRHHEIDRKEHEEAIEKVNRAWKMSWIIMISGAMLLIAFGTSFAAFYSRMFTKPIEIIHNGADAIASGDFKARLDIKTGDELQQLANAMNEMAAQLDSFYSNLQGMQGMVDERTREVQEREEKFRLFFNSGNDAVFVHTIGADGKPGNFIEVNEVACKRLGYASEELLNMSPYDIDASDMVEKREVVLKGFIANGQALFEMVHVAKDGTRIPVEINVRLFNLMGRPMVISFARDIAERKKAEEALRQSRALYLNTLESMMEGCQIIDFDWRYIYVNDAVARHGRKAKEDLIGRKMIELYPGIENTEMFAALRRCMDERAPQRINNEFIYPDGSKRWFELSIQPVPDGIFILSIDITERKQAEEMVKESEEKYRRLIENLKERYFFYSHAADGVFTYVSPSVTNILGYAQEEFLTHYSEYLTDNPVNKDVVYHTELSIKGIPQPPYLVEIFHKDRTTRWLEITEVPVVNKKGKVIAVEGVACDITEKKKAEERQKALYEFSQRIVSNLDLDSRVKSVCQTISEMGFKMSWIGILKMDTKDVIPMAHGGFEEGYLSSIKVKFDDSPQGQGPTGRAIKNKRPEVQEHIQTDPRYVPWREAATKRGYKSSAAFPIIDDDKVIAVLNVYNTAEEFPPRDLEFLQTFANQAAAYIRNARLFEEVKKSSERIKEEMEATTHLLMIAEATAKTTDIDKLMGQVMQCGHKIMGCDVCLSYLWDKEARVFRPAQCYGLAREFIPIFRTELLDEKIEFVRKIVEGKEAAIISQPLSPSTSAFSWLPDINTLAVIPLIGKTQYLGLIIGTYLGTDFKSVPSFTDRDKKVMQGISHQVSTALEEARLYKETVNKSMELSHKIETIQVMHEIDRSILSTLEAEDILETVTRLISKVISCDRATIVLVDNERQGFIYKAGFGVPFIQKGQLVPFKDTSAAEVVVKEGRINHISNLAEVKGLLPVEEKFLKHGFLSHIRLPLLVKGEIYGLLTVGEQKGRQRGRLKTFQHWKRLHLR